MKRLAAIVYVSLFIVAIPAFHGQADNLSQCKTRRITVVPYPFPDGIAQRTAKAFTTAAAMDPCVTPVDVYGLLEGADSKGLVAVDKAKDALHQGIRAFDSGSYKHAADLLQQAVDGFLPNYAAAGMSRDVVDALLYLGSARLALGQRKMARKAFLMALTLDPTSDVSSVTSMPEAMDLMQQVQARMQSLGTGAVSISSVPSGALVYVDGSFRGSAPITIQELHAGKHVITLMMVGFRRETRIVNILPNGLVNAGTVNMVAVPRATLLSEIIRRLLFGDDKAYMDAKSLVASDFMLVCRHDGARISASLFDLNRGMVFTRKSLDLGMGRPSGQAARHVLTGLLQDANRRLQAHNIPLPNGSAGSSSIVRKWWFWTAIGAVVVGGTTAAVLLTLPGGGGSGMKKDGTGSIILQF